MDRVTISIPNELVLELKEVAKKKKMAVSKIASEAIEQYLNIRKRRKLSKKVLDLIGEQKISSDIITDLEAGRSDCDSRI